MASSTSDGTCTIHNILHNVSASAYACGITFPFNDMGNAPDMQYAVVSLQRCCDMVSAPVLRIPGNSGCEMQFCQVPEATTTRPAAEPTSTGGLSIVPQPDVESCMRLISKGDLPEDVEAQVADAAHWCYLGMKSEDDDETSTKGAAVTASPAPPSWTAAAGEASGDAVSSSPAASGTASPSETTETSETETPASGGISRYNERSLNSLKIWAVSALVGLSLVAAL